MDDPIVPVQHSLVMQIALENNSISYEIHLFKKRRTWLGLRKSKYRNNAMAYFITRMLEKN
ncbi:hypothetical protein [Acinetobacter sp.]|uniref:hypothetical protein n=1 Tax=Acinetobacter sp. TaxID=472 RepID=UPI00338E9131